MKKKYNFLFIGIGIVASIISCTKDDIFNYDELEHTADWIFPLVKTAVAAEQVAKLTDLHFDIGVLKIDLEGLDESFPVPPISAETLGPVSMEDTDSIYVKFHATEATLKVYITNNFPINIKAGSVIEIRNSVINNNVVFSGTLARDIEAKGGRDSVVISNVTGMPWADNGLEFYFTNFASDGSSNVEDFNTYNNIDVSLKIEVLKLDEAEIYGNLNYILTDTNSFDFNSEESEQASVDLTNIESGSINLFISNGVPFTYYIQGYFLDANYQIVDSLFNSYTIESPLIDVNGYVVESSIQEVEVNAALTKDQYLLIEERTRYIYYKLEFTSQPQNVMITHSNTIGLQATADVKTKINLNND